MQPSPNQRGMTLVVVVLLLLLAGILSLFALNTGLFEQRASGNDLKAKLVGEAAEGGLSQGMEYLHQHPEYLTNTGKWTPCVATDTSFPCGSVPAPRRSSMYYWSSGGHDFDASGAVSGWEKRMLPIVAGNVFTGTNTLTPLTANTGMPVQYGVGAVLCKVAYKTLDTDPTTCVTFDNPNVSNSNVITLVSVASMPGEGARTTMTQSIGASNPFSSLPNTPPILAAGSVDINGGIQVVANPNSGGTGVPVSVWSRKDVAKTGTPNTCYYNEFLHSSSGSPNGSVYLDTASPNFPLCDNCNCGGSDSLSYTASGNKVDAGIDILQNSGANSDYSVPLAPGYANYDVKPQEFPCDLFQQVFGIKAWKDGDGDYFCETKLLTTFTNPNTNVDVTMGVDEAFLFTNADTILPSAATTAANLATANQLAVPAGKDAKGIASTTYPNSGFSGIVWCQVSCDIGSNQQLGSAAAPVLLVIDSGASVKIQGKVFGIVFLRSLAGGATLTPSAGYKMTTSEVATGGTASLTMEAGAVIYGAVVIQGTMTKANGSSAVVFNPDIIKTLGNSGSLTKYVGVPGSWTDRVSY